MQVDQRGNPTAYHKQLAADEMRAIYRLTGSIRIWESTVYTDAELNVDLACLSVDIAGVLEWGATRQWVAVGCCTREVAVALLDVVAPGWSARPFAVTAEHEIHVSDGCIARLAAHASAIRGRVGS